MPLRCRCDEFCHGAKHTLGADRIFRTLGPRVGGSAIDGAPLATDAHPGRERPSAQLNYPFVYGDKGNGTMSPVRILWPWFPIAIAVEEKLCSLLLRSEASATGFEAGSLPHCVCVCVTPSCVRHLVQSKASPKCWQFSRGRRLRFGTDPSTSRRRPLRRRRRRYDITTTDGTGWTRCGPGTSTRRHTTPNPPTVSFTSRTTSTTRTRDELKIRLLTRPVNVTLMGCARGHVSSLLCRLISRPSRLGRKRYGSTTYFFLLWYCSCVTCEGNKSFHIVGS